MVLEDEGARVAILGAALPPGACVTGEVVALRGRVTAKGDFEATGVAHAGWAPQAPRPAGEDK